MTVMKNNVIVENNSMLRAVIHSSDVPNYREIR